MANLTFVEDTDNIRSVIEKTQEENVDKMTMFLPDSETINIGDTITYQDNTSTTIFKGIVQSYKFGNGEKEVEVYDLGSELLQRNVNEIFTNQSPEAIIQSVLSTYAPSLSYSSTISSGLTIANYPAKNKRAWDIVTEMAEILLAKFRVDQLGTFYLETLGENSSSKSISRSNATLLGNWAQDISQQVNSVTVEGDRQVFDNIIENFAGPVTEVTLTNVPESVVVTVGGSQVDGYVPGQSTGDYYIDRENKKVIFDSSSSTIVVTYSYSVPVTVRKRDAESISTYGQKDKIYRRSYIKTRDEARKLCEFLLDRFKDPLFSSEWIITIQEDIEDFLSWEPNETISVSDTINNISDTYIIKKVIRDQGQLKITVGDPAEDILFWQKEAQNRIKQLEEKDNNSTILNEDESVSESLQVSFDIDTDTIKRRVYDSDTFYLSETSISRNQMLEDGTGPTMRNSGGFTETELDDGLFNSAGTVTSNVFSSTVSQVLTDLNTNISHIATGDDNTTPTISDTTLGNETLREAAFEESSSSTTYTISMFQDTGDNNGNNIEEIGLFNASSGGTMYQRGLTNVISKTSSIETFLTVNILVTVIADSTLN